MSFFDVLFTHAPSRRISLAETEHHQSIRPDKPESFLFSEIFCLSTKCEITANAVVKYSAAAECEMK